MKEQDDKKKPRKFYKAIRILIKSHEFIRCDQLYKNIIEKLPVGIKSIYVPLPNKMHQFSLLKAPHGYSKHRNMFSITNRKICVDIGSYEKLSPEALKELLTAIKNAKTLPGADIIIQCKYNDINA